MMKAKRSACDRCHAMKMQCKTDDSGKHCTRCRNADVPCNYSEPGRPGRPVTKSGNVANQNTAAAVNSKAAAVPTPSPTTADEDTWIRRTLTEYGAGEGSLCPREDHMGLCAQGGFLNFSPGSPYLHLDTTESLGPSDWSWNISEAEAYPTSTVDDNQQIHQGTPSEMEVTTDPNPVPATPETKTVMLVDKNHLEHLAYFQLKIARRISSLTHLEPAQLEQEAAHVLQSSSEFLGLIQMLTNVALECKASHQPSPVNMAVFLQLTSMSMRLTEMHYWLYSSIYHCLQRDDADFVGQDNTAGDGDKSPAKCLLLTIAGVELTPSPHFRLQILLHTGLHYFGRIQRSRGGLEALASDRISEKSPGLALQVHMLMVEDQRDCMANIQSVLNKLQGKLGMNVIL